MQQNPFASFNTPPVVKGLLIVNVVVFLLRYIAYPTLMLHFALWPLSGTPVRTSHGIEVISFHVWQLLTYGFLHAGFMHIFFNMFGLWMFGRAVETALGSARFLFYYLVCVIGAGICQLLTLYFFGSGVIGPTIGASGGIFGILLAFGMMFPNVRVLLLIPPIPMKAKWFVIGYGVLQLFFGVTGTMSGVAHFAHLGGMFFGLVMLLYWRYQAKARAR